MQEIKVDQTLWAHSARLKELWNDGSSQWSHYQRWQRIAEVRIRCAAHFIIAPAGAGNDHSGSERRR